MENSEEEFPVNVALRARPVNSSESSHSFSLCVTMSENMATVPHPVTRQGQKFSFAHNFWGDAPQESVYESTGKEVVTKCLEGYNGAVIVYGQVTSGKSYTMMGDDTEGIIPRMTRDLFNRIRNDVTENRKFLVTLSFYEINNEKIFDLLNPSDKTFHIHDHEDYGVFVEDMSEFVVKSEEEALSLLSQGQRVKAVLDSDVTRSSDLSHYVVTFIVSQKVVSDDLTERTLTSRVNLVEVAGSDSIELLDSGGVRLREGAAINRSLCGVCNVVSSIVEKKEVILYRDSTLSHVLKCAFGGNSVTCVIGCISPSELNLIHTFSTLVFCERARRVKNVISPRVDDSAKDVKGCEKEVEKLKGVLEKLLSSDDNQLDVTKMKEYEQTLRSLRAAQLQTWEEKERISAIYRSERQTNLGKIGLYNLLGDEDEAVRTREAAERMRKVKVERDEVMGEFDEQKKKCRELKAKYDEQRKEYKAWVAAGGGPQEIDPVDNKLRLGAIERARKTFQNEARKLEKLNERKTKLKNEYMHVEADMKSPDTARRREKDHMNEDNEIFLDTLRKKLQGQIIQEREKILRDYREKGEISVVESLDTEIRLFQMQEEKKLLVRQVAHLELHKEGMQSEILRLQKLMDLERERSAAKRAEMWNLFREQLEKEKRRIEEKYETQIQKAVKDMVVLGSKNRELNESLAEAQAGKG